MDKSLKRLTRIYDMLIFFIASGFLSFPNIVLSFVASALDRVTDVALASISHEQTR